MKKSTPTRYLHLTRLNSPSTSRASITVSGKRKTAETGGTRPTPRRATDCAGSRSSMTRKRPRSFYSGWLRSRPSLSRDLSLFVERLHVATKEPTSRKPENGHLADASLPAIRRLEESLTGRSIWKFLIYRFFRIASCGEARSRTSKTVSSDGSTRLS